MLRRRDPGPHSSEWQTVGLVLLVVVAVVLCALAVTRDPAPPAHADGVATDPDPSTDKSTSADGTATAPPSTDVTTVPTNPPAGEDGPPQVPDARRADFSVSDKLPDGARIYDNEFVGAGMAVHDGLLQHGRPTAPEALSSLETELDSDVRKLGARIRFPGDDSGSVVLVAWQDSLVDARRAGRPVPASGLRLVVSPGQWQLTSAPGAAVLASGNFTIVPGTATVEVYRDDDRAWVVDPSGAVTDVSDPRIEELAGPWACWQLYEQAPTQTPAVIEAVWAG